MPHSLILFRVQPASRRSRVALLLLSLVAVTLAAACDARENTSLPGPPERTESGDGDPTGDESANGDGDPVTTVEPADTGSIPNGELPVAEVTQPLQHGTVRGARDHERLRHGQLARVGHIIDGDTVDVLVDGVAFRTRIVGFDSPECEKASKTVDGIPRFRCVEDPENDHWGLEAYCEMVSLASGREVRVECDGTADGEACPLDVFDRSLAYLRRVEDGVDVGLALVRAGGGWTFTRYDSERRAEYCAAEDAAIEEGAGMWAIGRQAVIDGMDGGTRGWYRHRDERCRLAAEAR